MPTIERRLRDDELEMIHDFRQGRHLHGECYALAIAIARATDLPIVGLISSDGEIIHAAVRLPDGTLHDGRGPVSEEEFGKPFDHSPPYNLREVTEAELFATRPISEIIIETATRWTEILWPNLPWKETSLRNRTRAFLDDLEAISRKHGFWIRAPFPAQPPILAKAEDDEGGYAMRPTCDGLSYAFDRYFKNDSGEG